MTGSELIAAERERQIKQEGWSVEHDREHGARRLVRAANAYETENPQRWPFEPESYKPKGALRNLVRAGALYWAAADVDGTWHVPSQGTTRCAEKIDTLIAEVRAVLDGTAEYWEPCELCGRGHEDRRPPRPWYDGLWEPRWSIARWFAERRKR